MLICTLCIVHYISSNGSHFLMVRFGWTKLLITMYSKYAAHIRSYGSHFLTATAPATSGLLMSHCGRFSDLPGRNRGCCCPKYDHATGSSQSSGGNPCTFGRNERCSVQSAGAGAGAAPGQEAISVLAGCGGSPRQQPAGQERGRAGSGSVARQHLRTGQNFRLHCHVPNQMENEIP